MRYWYVLCERGHVGSGMASEIKFAIAADNLMQAYEIARKLPSVKHSRMPISGKEISKAEYEEFKAVSAYDRYPQYAAQKREWHGNRHQKKKTKKNRR